MKPKTTLRHFRSLAFASSTLISISYMQAAEYYWDNNGTTAGFGTATGTWVGAGTVGSGTQGWGTDITGLIAPTGTITTLSTNATTDALNFGTGVAGLGAGTITVSGTVQAGGITFGAASGAIDLSGGTINLTATQITTSNNTTNTISSILSGAGTSFTKAGTGTLDLGGVNTYTGATNVSAGTLTLSGNRTATAGAFNVGNLASSTGTLNVTNGNFTVGTTQVAGATGAVGIMNQSGGTLTTSGNQLLIGALGGTGTYNLSAGQLNTIAGALGVTLGVNSNSTGNFNLSGTGILNMAGTSTLQIGRSQVVNSATTNTTGVFNQTGGTATVGILAMGGISTDAADNAGANATLTLTGGTFSAVTFSALSGGNNSVSTINIGGTAVVTLPNFPTARGSGATATLNFDGGTLRNSATGTFITGLTNAFIEDGGAQFDTSLNSATISQNLLTHGSSLGGGLTKIGANTLTLTGTNTYTGATTINAGTLNLGGATANGSLASTVLTLGGGSLNYSRTGTNSQDFTTTSISGASMITGSATNTLNLGTVTRGTNNSFFDFGATGLSLISALAASNDASGIMPGFTVGDSWAVANGSGVAISGLAGGSYTQTSAAGATAANYAALNMDVNNSAGLLSGAITTNSLRFSTAAANTVTLATGTNTITTGGILIGSAVGSNLSTITGGTLTGAASKDLAIIQNNASGGLTISSSIIDNTLTSVTKAGAGTLTLTAANTYTGATAIYGGELSLTGSASLGSGTYAGAITNTATLRYSSSANQTLSGVISGAAGILIKDTSATSTLTLSNTNTYTGGTIINAGTLKLSGAGTLGPAGASVAVSSGAVLDLNGTNQSIAFAAGTGVGTVANNSGSGTSILTLAGTASINGGRVTIVDNTDSSSGKVAVVITANTQSMSNLNTYSGGTTVNAGAFFLLDSTSPLGAGTGTINLTASGGSGSGLLVNSGAIYANDVSGAGYIHNNTTSGTAVLTGTLNTSGTINFRNSAAAFDFAGSGNSTLSGVIGPAGENGVHGPNTTVSTGKIIKSGTGTLTLSGANLYSGGTTISGGTLVFRNTGAKASGGTHAFAGDTTLGLGVGGAGFFSSADITSAFGTGTILTNVTVTATTNVAIDTTAGNLTHSADITGSPTKGLTKLGANSLTLGGANTYTGATMVSAGTLLVNNTTGSGTGSNMVTVDINGTLGGSGTISGAVTVDGYLSPGNSTGLLTVGSLNLNASSSTTLEINGTNRGAVTDGYDALGVNTGGSIDHGGALSFVFGNLAAFADSTEFDLFSFDTTSTGDFSGVTSTGFYAGTWGKTGDIWTLTDEGQTLNFSEVTGNLTVVPEPGAALLGSIGMLILLRRRRS